MIRADVRIVQPASVFYEVAVNTFLLLDLLGQHSQVLFSSKIEQIFGNLWSPSLAAVSELFYSSGELAWSRCKAITSDPYVRAKVFVMELRDILQSQWTRDVEKRISKDGKKGTKKIKTKSNRLDSPAD